MQCSILCFLGEFVVKKDSILYFFGRVCDEKGLDSLFFGEFVVKKDSILYFLGEFVMKKGWILYFLESLWL